MAAISSAFLYLKEPRRFDLREMFTRVGPTHVLNSNFPRRSTLNVLGPL